MLLRARHPELPASRQTGFQGLIDEEMPKQVRHDTAISID